MASGVNVHPSSGAHASVVQSSPSSQTVSAPDWHAPATQRSGEVQTSSSEQDEPSGSIATEHCPVMKLHTLAEHGSAGGAHGTAALVSRTH
jgi:hypothetical protein